ncbi:zinc-dependent alcohol dehydrogenase family protein [Microbulbifer sp. YPW16]|uniref:zinc-dependent alcohol dehydrogenase family protein n=1 Tax=Microbulbifer sp. YPW16 TaxID=2904242 RepID=UPI001E4AEC51|nr:zinc-dependent alcohol dehydrogenase family protein [Microbulbifer sp. YPW16]UHQ55882.1 zinc-dependent alcohol dehydrogenase family protein [Microbulbifer sp. YPW16]
MLKAEYQSRGPVPQEVIEAVECETPELKEGEVLLELLASPINPSDVLTLTGDYGMLPPLPAVGGNEGVARVVEHGPGVSAPEIGQTVLLPVGIGTWRTHFTVPADKLLPLPNEADPLQLSMISINPPTASLMLSEFVDLQPGDWVIQNAANSGVGNYLIQLAHIRGFKTVNIVRRESLVEPLKAQGADVVLVDGDDLPARVKEATGGADIKLGIDAVGDTATGRIADCLAEGGTLVNYGMMSGKPCKISPTALIFKGVSMRGFWLARWFEAASPQDQQKVYGELTKLIIAGKLKAPIDSTFSVKDIKDAVAAAAEGGRDGKILVTA